jgi:VanZ family protein
MSARRYRGSLAVWVLLLAYASLYPFFPLRAPAGDALAAFFSPERYISRSDVAFNVVAYVPLGMLAALYFRTLGSGRFAVGKAVMLGAAFSLAMEVLQVFVPNPWPRRWTSPPTPPARCWGRSPSSSRCIRCSRGRWAPCATR